MQERGRGSGPPNKAMKLTRLSAVPRWLREHPAEGAASCPRRHETAGTASQLIASVRPTQGGGCSVVRLGLPLAVGVLVLAGCGIGRPVSKSDALDVQEATIEFLAGQSGSVRSDQACVRVATGPGEMVDGLVWKSLEGLPSSSVQRLRARGIAVSECDSRQAEVLFAIGWPTVGHGEVELHADVICGPGCGRGYLVHLRRHSGAWRAIDAHGTWVK